MARLQLTGGESVSRLALFVPEVPIVWTPPTKYVGVGQVGLGPHTVGPFRSLANEVSHWIWRSVVHQRRCAVDDDAAVTAEGTERPVAGRRRPSDDAVM